MNRWFALFILGVLLMGVVGTVYGSYLGQGTYSVLSGDGDDHGEEGDGDSSSGDGSPHRGDSHDDESHEEEYEEYEEFMDEYKDGVEEFGELTYKVNIFNSSGYNVSHLYTLLSDVEGNLTLALDAYNSGDIAGAWTYLRNAKVLLVQVEKSLKSITKSGKFMSMEMMEEEDEDDYLEYMVMDGNITISSKDNDIDFRGDRPKIEFSYSRNNTSVEFSVKDFVFIEFVDLNGNGVIDEGEVLQRVSSKDLSWESNVTTNTLDHNTEIIISYYANTSSYEIELVMHVYNYSIVANTTIGNKTITITVDGGADQVKYDFIVYKWPWMANDSLLALYNEIEVEVGTGASLQSVNADENAINVDLGSVVISVSWIKYATVDGSPVTVSTYYKSLELEAGEGEASLELEVFFIYPNFGNSILIHDPSIGLLEGLASSVVPLITMDTLLVFGLSSFIIAAVAIILARKGYIASIV